MPTIEENRIEIINTIKLLIYKENPSLLEKVDLDNDNIFLEPLLFAYFNFSNNNKYDSELLSEIMQGYFTKREKIIIKYSFNKNGIAYLPEIGYFKKNELYPFDTILKVDGFEIIKEIHPTQEPYFIEYYRGQTHNENPIYNSAWQENHKDLEKAILIIKECLPNFYEELVFANRKIFLHNNPKILNFTTIKTLGNLYFYVIDSCSLLYFIEELIHQGAHNFLYYFIGNMEHYFKIDVENLIMRDFTKQEWDYRDIYGAYHGLYTVAKRVECFDILLSSNVFSGKEKHELLGRLTDQFRRFRTGLELLNFDEVFTKKGQDFYFEYDEKCLNTLNKYKILPSIFDLSNRDVDFRYDDFCILNPIEEFYKKEDQGFFNF